MFWGSFRFSRSEGVKFWGLGIRRSHLGVSESGEEVGILLWGGSSKQGWQKGIGERLRLLVLDLTHSGIDGEDDVGMRL